MTADGCGQAGKHGLVAIGARIDARQFRHRAHVAQFAQGVEFLFRQVELAKALQKLRRQKPRLAQPGRQIFGQPGMDQRQRIVGRRARSMIIENLPRVVSGDGTLELVAEQLRAQQVYGLMLRLCGGAFTAAFQRPKRENSGIQLSALC